MGRDNGGRAFDVLRNGAEGAEFQMIQVEDWCENDWDTLTKKCEAVGISVIGIRRVGSMFEVKILSEKDIFVACAPTREAAVDRCFQRFMEYSSCPNA
jgi:hypothetical protein